MTKQQLTPALRGVEAHLSLEQMMRGHFGILQITVPALSAGRPFVHARIAKTPAKTTETTTKTV